LKLITDSAWMDLKAICGMTLFSFEAYYFKPFVHFVFFGEIKDFRLIA